MVEVRQGQGSETEVGWLLSLHRPTASPTKSAPSYFPIATTPASEYSLGRLLQIALVVCPRTERSLRRVPVWRGYLDGTTRTLHGLEERSRPTRPGLPSPALRSDLWSCCLHRLRKRPWP